jgi:hypothetical protein
MGSLTRGPSGALVTVSRGLRRTPGALEPNTLDGQARRCSLPVPLVPAGLEVVELAGLGENNVLIDCTSCVTDNVWRPFEAVLALH